MDFVEVNTQAQIDATAALAEIIWTDHYVQIVGKRQVEYMLDKFQAAKPSANRLPMVGCIICLPKMEKKSVI